MHKLKTLTKDVNARRYAKRNVPLSKTPVLSRSMLKSMELFQFIPSADLAFYTYTWIFKMEKSSASPAMNYYIFDR